MATEGAGAGMITFLTWVPKGAASRKPKTYQLSPEDIAAMKAEL